MALGWRELDWGLAQQQSDGGFSSKDPFHSTSFFVEALARLPDRSGGRHARVHRGAGACGAAGSRPDTSWR